MRRVWRRMDKNLTQSVCQHKKKQGIYFPRKLQETQAHVSTRSQHHLFMRPVLAATLNRKLAVVSIAFERQRTMFVSHS